MSFTLYKNSNQILFDFINEESIYHKPKKDKIRRIYKDNPNILASQIIQLPLFDLQRGSK